MFYRENCKTKTYSLRIRSYGRLIKKLFVLSSRLYCNEDSVCTDIFISYRPLISSRLVESHVKSSSIIVLAQLSGIHKM